MLIDVTRLADRRLQGTLPTGVDRVSLEYIRHFRAHARALVRVGGRWVVVNNGDSQRVFDALLEPGEDTSNEIRWCVGRSYALSWGGGSRPSVLLNTGHSGLDSDTYAAHVRRQGWKPIFFLHDLIPISYPEYGRPGEADRHCRRLMTICASGQGLIVNSAATREAAEAYALRCGWPLPPCVVAPLAPAPLPKPDTHSPLEKPYFVILGTIEPRKNHLLLLHLWRQLAHEMGEAAPHLVIIGRRGWECEQVVDLLERCTVLRGLVIERSYCRDAELSTWLRHAQALLFPSFAEGYGLPIVEALSHQVPVIASNLPVFREIAQEIPDYLDPHDGAGWKQAILDYAQPLSLARSAQFRRMRAFRPPTWDEHFSIVEQLMRRLHVGN
ncbi:MAG: glycosyltransferase family 4 protein [Nitrospira sp.]|nr:glycosyltransferase family 4 protein [Nitrospira sp.]